MAKLKDVNQKKYRAVIQYDRDFPKYFDLGDLSKNEANVVYALLGEIRDKYSPDGITVSYSDIAYMSDNVLKNSDGVYYANTGKHFNRFIEEIQTKLKLVSYKKFIKMDEKGNSVFEDYPLFTEKFRVDHINQELTVHISEAVYQNEILDEAGNIIQNKKRVVDLFNNDDWSETKYLKFGRELHNQLKKYGQNLYRWIAEYRSINRPIAIDAEVFENIIMKFTTPYAKKNKLTILNSAIKELQSLTYDDGRQIIRDLEYTIERKNRKIVKYIFSFKPFSIDLNYIKSINGSNIVFEESSASKGDDNHLEYFNVIQLFLKTFSNKPEYDNKNNRQRLVKFCQSMSEEVVVVALDKVTMNKRRGPGWLFKTLENWEKAGVKKMEDIESAEREIFGESQKTNVPSWSNPNYRNEITEEQRQELERKKAEMLKKLDS
jgi:replication protein